VACDKRRKTSKKFIFLLIYLTYSRTPKFRHPHLPKKVRSPAQKVKNESAAVRQCMKQKKAIRLQPLFPLTYSATQKVQNEDRLKLQAIATKNKALPKKCGT
jgi:hypothetical protein